MHRLLSDARELLSILLAFIIITLLLCMKMSILLKTHTEVQAKLYGILDLLLNTSAKKGEWEEGGINELECQNLNVEYRNFLYVSISFCDYLKLVIIIF